MWTTMSEDEKNWTFGRAQRQQTRRGGEEDHYSYTIIDLRPVARANNRTPLRIETRHTCRISPMGCGPRGGLRTVCAVESLS